MAEYRDEELPWTPSEFQIAVIDALLDTEDNLFIEASAGAGKSTTLEMLSRYIGRGNRIAIAFNNAIVDELSSRLQPFGMRVTTNHKLGYSWLRMVRPNCRVDKDKYKNILAEIVEQGLYIDQIEKKFRSKSVPQYWICRLFDLWLLTGTHSSKVAELAATHELEISHAYDHYLVPVMKEMWRRGKAQLMLEGKTANTCAKVDFVDMIVAPTRAKFIEMAVGQSAGDPRYDIILGDECQDWSKAHVDLVQQSLRPTGRLVIVGDPKQAIYGFAGAMDGSTDELVARFNCRRMPLPVSYRCPVSHVVLAQQLVPAIMPKADAATGTVGMADEREMIPMLKKGDLVVCRYTAPLLKACFALIQRQIPSSVKGKDMGGQLYGMAVRTHEREEKASFVDKLVMHEREQRAWLENHCSPKRLKMAQELLADKVECLRDIWRTYQLRDLKSLKGVLAVLFTENGSQIQLSSIHRAKGLEAKRVFFLHHERVPHPEADGWMLQEERNLRYVALTRSYDTLYLVTQHQKADTAKMVELPNNLLHVEIA